MGNLIPRATNISRERSEVNKKARRKKGTSNTIKEGKDEDNSEDEIEEESDDSGRVKSQAASQTRLR
jgi:hypothetical protein